MPRTWMLALAALCVFAIVAAILMNVTPGPLKGSDYLVIGSVATLLALLVLFLAVISTAKSRDIFFKRRRK